MDEARGVDPGERDRDVAAVMDSEQWVGGDNLGGGAQCGVAGAGLAGTGSLPEGWWRPIVGAALGVAAYLATAGAGRHVVRRMRGITGDVLGAAVETGTAATLVAAVLLL